MRKFVAVACCTLFVETDRILGDEKNILCRRRIRETEVTSRRSEAPFPSANVSLFGDPPRLSLR
jgi:hypothetical protein